MSFKHSHIGRCTPNKKIKCMKSTRRKLQSKEMHALEAIFTYLLSNNNRQQYYYYPTTLQQISRISRCSNSTFHLITLTSYSTYRFNHTVIGISLEPHTEFMHKKDSDNVQCFFTDAAVTF